MLTSQKLGSLLKEVSRSFYLTLWVLPANVRDTIGLAYLFCRSADTIADTTLIAAAERIKVLELFRNQFHSSDLSLKAIHEIQNSVGHHQANPSEEILLRELSTCFDVFQILSKADQDHIRELLTTLTKGMEMDLIHFPRQNSLQPLPLLTEDELDQYTYYVAGVVGKFWTQILISHFPSISHWNEDEMVLKGIHFGKGLQMTNILKDLSKDLSRGRCYIPKTLLDQFGVKPHQLLESSSFHLLKPILIHLIKLTLGHLEIAWQYILSIPKREFRMRLACLWPHFFALKTLYKIYHSEHLLDPKKTIKISRQEVYKTMAITLILGFSDTLLTIYYKRLFQKVRTMLPND